MTQTHDFSNEDDYIRFGMSCKNLDIDYVNKFLKRNMTAKEKGNVRTTINIQKFHRDYIEKFPIMSDVIIESINDYLKHFKPNILFNGLSELVRTALNHKYITDKMIDKEINKILTEYNIKTKINNKK